MEKGTTLKDGLARWTSSEKCPHGTWTLRWETPVNYSIDAPLVFTGSFRQALEQLFALYTRLKNRCMPGPALHNACSV